MKVPDYIELLSEHRIEYIERGKNVKRGQINIKCPFCGTADPSHHMGLDLESGWWACWRNSNHRGKSPVRLLVKLLNIPYWSARELCGLGKDYVDPDGFSTVIHQLRSAGWSKDSKKQRQAVKVLDFDPDFRPISGGFATRRHVEYLVHERLFDEADVLDLAYDYDLRATISGQWAHRVIMPYYMDGALVTWTARAMAGQEPRYRDLSIDESVVPPKLTLYNHDALIEGGKFLVAVEGPMDTLKLDFYAKRYGVRAVGLSTNTISEEQQFILAEGAKRFEGCGFMMDRNSGFGAIDNMRMMQQLRFMGADMKALMPPAGRKDAGECHPSEIREFARELVRHVI